MDRDALLELRQVVDEVRSHVPAIHDEERWRSVRWWAAMRERLDHEGGSRAPAHEVDGQTLRRPAS